MKKTKNEKRRLLLNKRLDQKTIEKKRAKFARPADSKLFVKANGSEAVRTPLNKRLIAIILAIVMVAGLIPAGVFMLRPKAAEMASLGPVEMMVSVNGIDDFTTAIVQAGELSNNANDAEFAKDLPAGVQFRRAIVFNSDTHSETEISSVGSLTTNNITHDYYSIETNANSGTLLDDDQVLILEMASKNEVTLNYNEDGGTATTSAIDDGESNYVWGGDELRIQVSPKTDFKVGSITYSVNGGSLKNATIVNNAATISKTDIIGDISVNVAFVPITSYIISDVRYKNASTYYPEWVGFDSHGGLANSGKTADITSASVEADSPAPDGTAEFYIFSEANSGNHSGSNYYVLNKIGINGVDIAFPTQVESSVSTPFRGGAVTVEMVDTAAKLNYKGDNNLFSSKTRSLYKITVTKVHEDLDVVYNFKGNNDRRIIINGLRGIDRTGASVEDTSLTSIRYYYLDSNEQDLYTTYYDGGLIPSDNLIVFTMKPGYNPYTLERVMSTDGGATYSTQSVRPTDAIDTPLNVILAAGSEWGDDGRYNTFWRNWGYVSSLDRIGELEVVKAGYKTTDHNGTPLLLNTLYTDGDYNGDIWYAIALDQNPARSQILRINAAPYKYKLELETGNTNATLSASGFSALQDEQAQGNVYLEDGIHTVEDSQAYALTPSATPVWDNKHVFLGWQLLDQSGELVSNHIYQSNTQVPLTEDVLEHAYGDAQGETLTLHLRSIWKETKQAPTTQVFTGIYFEMPDGEKEINGKTYNIASEKIETQVTGAEVALLNMHFPSPSSEKYYALNSSSIINLTAQAQDEIGSVPDDNNLLAIYDLKMYSFDVKKEVAGRPKTSEYRIKVKLTRPDDYPLTLQQVVDNYLNWSGIGITVDIDGDSITFTKSYVKDEEINITGVPFGWEYKVSEEQDPGDYETSFIVTPNKGETSADKSTWSGTINDDTSVIVRNQRLNDDPNIVSDKWLEKGQDGTYTLTMDTYALAQQITEEKANTTPLDIVLVIDQSGSMGNEDMNPSFKKSDQTSWTAEEAAGTDTTYYYKVGEGTRAVYYPVQAEIGSYYQAVGSLNVRSIVGVGHSHVVGTSSTPHFNIPTNYYYIDSNNEAHKVYLLSIGYFGAYCVYPYYFVEESSDYAGWPEWYHSGLTGFLEDAGLSDLVNDNKWNQIVTSNSGIRLIDPNGTTTYSYNVNNLKNVKRKFTWGGILANQEIDNLSQKTASSVPNRLYYIDENEEKRYLASKPSLVKDDIAYSGDLYYVGSGTSRLLALQNAVTNFVNGVASNVADTGAQHQISIVGFAGNETPGFSRLDGVVNSSGSNSSNDYVNTGMFINGTFKNYKEITRFTRHSGGLSTNSHYYIQYGGEYQPIIYRNGTWYRMEKSTNRMYSIDTNSYTIYDPDYDDLTNEYSNAFVDVTDSNGSVNSVVTDTIAQFGSYGGTYTSYGMAMTNQIFENNSANGHKRVVVVFTDGEPGANGYDEAIAGEAKADAEITKRAYDASVYTVGLFVGKPTSEVSDFMKELSSEKTISRRNVLKANLNPHNTYWYYDSSSKKTYAVRTEYQNESTLGWWAAEENIRFTNVNEDSTNGVKFYSRKTASSWYEVDAEDIDVGSTYYVNANNTWYTITYQYKWYDSDGYVVEPKATASGSGYQFFEFADSSANSDGVAYYQYTNNPTALKNIFNSISESIITSKNTVDISSENTFIRDVFSDSFDWEGNNDQITLQLINGTRASKDVPASFTTIEPAPSTIRAEWDSNKRSLDIQGYDFGEYYIAPADSDKGIAAHPGKKLRIVLTGLVPKTKAVGGIFASNQETSGVYLYETDEEGNVDTSSTPKLADAFPVPEISRYKYTIDVEGADTSTKYQTVFEAEDSEGNSININALKHDVNNPSDMTIQNIAGSQTKSMILEQINDVSQFEVLLSNGDFKHSDGVPDAFDITATVSTIDSSPNIYNYMKQVDDEETLHLFDPQKPFEVTEKSNGENHVHLVTEERKVTVVLQELTEPESGHPNYTDPEKKFDVLLTLKDREGNLVDYADSDIVFQNGFALLEMKHEDTAIFSVPAGYKLSIDVEESSQGEYRDSYSINGGEETSPTLGETTIEEFSDVKIYNRLSAPDIASGVLDTNNPFGIILAVLAGICAIAAGITVYCSKKRKKETEA